MRAQLSANLCVSIEGLPSVRLRVLRNGAFATVPGRILDTTRRRNIHVRCRCLLLMALSNNI